MQGAEKSDTQSPQKVGLVDLIQLIEDPIQFLTAMHQSLLENIRAKGKCLHYPEGKGSQLALTHGDITLKYYVSCGCNNRNSCYFNEKQALVE